MAERVGVYGYCPKCGVWSFIIDIRKKCLQCVMEEDKNEV